MLEAARGYGVFDRRGTRIGAFIELTGPGGDRIAIRHEGVFVWRRRVVPITNVAKVLPDRRTVVLTIDGHALAGTEAQPTPVPGASDIVEKAPRSSGDWQERIERYIAPAESQAERHLLFISTSRGYALVEQEGPPPPLGRGVELPEQAVSFFVAKLGRSPLPNDPRICAYLEPTK